MKQCGAKSKRFLACRRIGCRIHHCGERKLPRALSSFEITYCLVPKRSALLHPFFWGSSCYASQSVSVNEGSSNARRLQNGPKASREHPGNEMLCRCFFSECMVGAMFHCGLTVRLVLTKGSGATLVQPPIIVSRQSRIELSIHTASVSEFLK